MCRGRCFGRCGRVRVAGIIWWGCVLFCCRIAGEMPNFAREGDHVAAGPSGASRRRVPGRTNRSKRNHHDTNASCENCGGGPADGGSRLRNLAAARCGAALPRRIAADRKTDRRRSGAHDARREGRRAACAVEILVGRRAASGHSRGVVHRRPARHPARSAVGSVGPGGLDQRFVHGFPGADVSGRDVEPRHVGPLRPFDRRGGPLPREGRAAGARRQHLPHADERPQFRIHGRGPLPGCGDGGPLCRGGAEERGGRLREAFRAEQPGAAPSRRGCPGGRPGAP